MSRGPVAEHLDGIEIYSGRHQLGYVVEQAGQWLARTDNNELVGTYPTRRAATDAIIIVVAK